MPIVFRLVFCAEFENHNHFCWKSKLARFLAILYVNRSNVREFQSCSNMAIWPTIRRRISRWIQKCIALYVYLHYFERYCHFTAKIYQFWAVAQIFLVILLYLTKYSRYTYKVIHFWNQREILRRMVRLSNFKIV